MFLIVFRTSALCMWPRLQKLALTSSYLNFDSNSLFIYWINDFGFHSKRKMRLLSLFWNDNQSHWCSRWENANQSLAVMTSELVSVDRVTFMKKTPLYRARSRNFFKSHGRFPECDVIRGGGARKFLFYGRGQGFRRDIKHAKCENI